MTFYDITMKMLRANFRRYRLYFACNVFCIVLFYCFAALFTNRSFMDFRVNDSMISSNVIAPSVFIAAFMLVFVPYTYRAFMKNRSYEYGVFMTLGMSERQALYGMLLENGVVAAASLLAGLVLGTAVSFGFLALVKSLFGALRLSWYFNAASYLWTAALYAAAMLLTLLAGAAGFARAKLTDLLREKFRAEKTGRSPRWLFPAGLLLAAASVPLMLLPGGTGLWGVGILVMAAGLLMIIALPGAPAIRTRWAETFRQRHLLGVAFVRQHGKSGRHLCFFTLWMFAFTALFAGICLLLFPINRRYAFGYNPFDLEYAQDAGGSQVQGEEVSRLLQENGVTVISQKTLPFLGDAAFNLFPASELNKAFGCRYTVKSGEFVALFQYDLHDGYGHDISFPQMVFLPCGKKDLTLRPAGRDVRILFNPESLHAYKTLVLSDADYRKLASQSGGLWRQSISLYRFADWQNSAKGVAAVQAYYWNALQIPAIDRWAYRVDSKVTAYATGMQSAGFLMLLMFFVMALFCTAADLTVHFRIRSEAEEERRILGGLGRAGVTDGELLAMLRFKDRVYFLPQTVMGVLVGAFCIFTLTKGQFAGLQWEAGGISLLVGAALTALQWLLSARYSRREWQRGVGEGLRS